MMEYIYSYQDYRDMFCDKRLAKQGLVQKCPYCDASLSKVMGNEGESNTEKVDACLICGWYQYYRQVHQQWAIMSNCAQGILRRFSIDDIEAPTQELSDYLVSKYATRFDIHPRKLEEIVSSIFRNMGFRVELTSYSQDNGIDLFLITDDAGSFKAVQVKRYGAHRPIGVSRIREFLGAMMLNNVTSGIYVTTSRYTRASVAASQSKHLREKNIRIDLWDAEKLFDALNLYRGNRRPVWEIFWDHSRDKLWQRGHHLRDQLVRLFPPHEDQSEPIDVYGYTSCDYGSGY